MPPPPGQADAIVVLSAGLAPDGTMGGQTARRTQRGIALYQAGHAPTLVMSGGREPGERSKAELMAEAARDAGIPATAIVAEDRSRSTLQNALFVEEALGAEAGGRLILVTHRYHLPRAWASFRWAGMNDLALAPARVALRPGVWHGTAMEAVKWPVNAARAALYSGLIAAGVTEPRAVPLLR